MEVKRISPREAAKTFFAELHPDADCLLLAGSFVRGEATAHSDLDLVVLYPALPQAYRVSLIWDGYPVETFVHDPETLRYFFEKIDGPSGFPLLMQMVREGIEVPGPTPLSTAMKRLASEVLDAGPPPLTEDSLRAFRYKITDVIDDIRDPHSSQELRASGAHLYDVLADFYFRSQLLWSARGKMVLRKLQQHSPEFRVAFESAFEALFVAGKPQPVVELAEEMLRPHGGRLFEGYKVNAPLDFKIKDELES